MDKPTEQALATQEEKVLGLRPEIIWKLALDSFAERASGGKWIAWKYLVYIAEKVQEIILEGQNTGKEQYIIIEAPVRHGKSWLIDYWLPTWFLEMWPEKRVMLGTYSDSFAETWGRKVLDEFQKNDLLTTKINPDKAAASDFLTVDGGGMRTFGVNSTVTGLGADLMIVDDPVKNVEEAYSEVYRDKLYMQFWGDIFTRVEPGGTLILMMARRHEDDLIGRIKRDAGMEDGSNAKPLLDGPPVAKDVAWHVIRLPALAEANDELGRPVGEALCPERYDEANLLLKKKKLPSALWNGLYQQRPSAMEGNLFKVKNWRHWDERTLPKKFDDMLISMDTNVEEGADNDFTVIQAWGKVGAKFYLIDQTRGVWDMTGQVNGLKAFIRSHPGIKRKLIEKKANGPAIQNLLKKTVTGIQLVEPQGSKYERAMATEPLQTAGDIFLPADDLAFPWVEEDFKPECTNFPKGAHDDQVDAMTQAMVFWNGTVTDFFDKINRM